MTCENRELFDFKTWQMVRGPISRPGKSSFLLECPFCHAVVEAFCWSLAGGGKRCECGAKITSFEAYKLKAAADV